MLMSARSADRTTTSDLVPRFPAPRFPFPCFSRPVLARELLLTDIIQCYKEIRVLPSGTLPQSLDLRKIRHGKKIVLSTKFVDSRACGSHLLRPTRRCWMDAYNLLHVGRLQVSESLVYKTTDGSNGTANCACSGMLQVCKCTALLCRGSADIFQLRIANKIQRGVEQGQNRHQ